VGLVVIFLTSNKTGLKKEFYWSVSRFQEKEKRGEMITKNDNIK
jgi:hypothetical protein